jgi:hypothetical protein
MRKRAVSLTFLAFVLVWTATASVAAAAAAAGKNSNGRQGGGAWYDRSLWSDPVSTSMRTQPASERKEVKRNPKPRPSISQPLDEDNGVMVTSPSATPYSSYSQRYSTSATRKKSGAVVVKKKIRRQVPSTTVASPNQGLLKPSALTAILTLLAGLYLQYQRSQQWNAADFGLGM